MEDARITEARVQLQLAQLECETEGWKALTQAAKTVQEILPLVVANISKSEERSAAYEARSQAEHDQRMAEVEARETRAQEEHAQDMATKKAREAERHAEAEQNRRLGQRAVA